MPAGIIATVDGDYATIDFVDQSLRGPALAELAELGAPIETITRDGPRRKYRVLVNFAEQVNLLDLDEEGEVTNPGRVHSAGHDTGAAAALVAADPNVNPGADNADWHTPVDQYTSANKYVGQVANDVVLDRAQVYTGDASSYGGSGRAPLHTEVIAAVRGGTIQAVQQVASFGHPGAEANLSLGTQDSALATDPGATPDVGGSFVAEDYTSVQATRDEPLAGPEDVTVIGPDGEPENTENVSQGGAEPVTEGTQAAPVTEADGAARPDGLPEGEPNADWLRPQLESYATWKGIENPAGYPNKAELLTAIENA
ncbi:hypothetical protein Jolie1_012 [Mycobacterium phage Julie1]|uniref:Uncharacterized protein n=1 Tax=Mycobacterium phage Julie1 TaxID=1463812 RepID=W8EB38_9CAUD|nr:hypothetical protein CG90_gp12 [Mycobacterium phage Julie1]AHJ88512.1 hypothetical protein Jolie1_012 [Mycobacterium phage Julie1]